MNTSLKLGSSLTLNAKETKAHMMKLEMYRHFDELVIDWLENTKITTYYTFCFPFSDNLHKPRNPENPEDLSVFDDDMEYNLFLEDDKGTMMTVIFFQNEHKSPWIHFDYRPKKDGVVVDIHYPGDVAILETIQKLLIGKEIKLYSWE